MRFTNIYFAISSLIYASLTNTEAYHEDLPMDDLVAAIATAAINGAIPFNFLNFHQSGTNRSPDKIRIPVLLITESDLQENNKYTAKYGAHNGFRGGKSQQNRFQHNNNLQKPDYSPKPKYPTNGIRIVPAPKLHAPVDDLKPVQTVPNRPYYENKPLRSPSVKLVKQPQPQYQSQPQPQPQYQSQSQPQPQPQPPKIAKQPVYDDEDEEQAQDSPAAPVAPLSPVGKVAAKIKPTKGKIPERFLNLLPPLPDGADTFNYNNKDPLEFVRQEGSAYRSEPVVRHKSINLGDVYRSPDDEESQEASQETSQEQNGSQEQNFDGYVKTPYDNQLVTTLKKLMTNNNKKDNNLNLNIGGEVYQTGKEEQKESVNSNNNNNNNNNFYESNFNGRVNTNADYYQTESQSAVYNNNNNNPVNTINQPQKFYYRPPVTRLITNNNDNNNNNNDNYRTYSSQPTVYQRENNYVSQNIPQTNNYVSQELPQQQQYQQQQQQQQQYQQQQSAIPFPSPFAQTSALTNTQLPQTIQYYSNTQQNEENSLPQQSDFRSQIPEKYMTPLSEQQQIYAKQQHQQQQQQQQQQLRPYNPVFETNIEPMLDNNGDSGYTEMVQFLPPKTTRQRFQVPMDMGFEAKPLSQQTFFLNDGNSKLPQTQTYISDPQPIQNEQQTTVNRQSPVNSYVVTGAYRQQVQDNQDKDDKNVGQEDEQTNDNSSDKNEEQSAEQNSNDDNDNDNDNSNEYTSSS